MCAVQTLNKKKKKKIMTSKCAKYNCNFSRFANMIIEYEI